MTGLLELKEKLKRIYSKYDIFIVPVLKFLLALIVLSAINSTLGYMVQLDNMAIVLMVALLCSFLPIGSIALFGILFSMAHMFSLSIETLAVGFCMYLLMFLLFIRFSSKEIIVVILTPVLFILKIPYVMPVALGLLGTPASAVSVGCGVAVYYMFSSISANATTITSMGDDAVGKLRLLIDSMLGNKAMFIMIIAFAVTVVVVYLVRRMSIDHSWTIAIVSGSLLDMIILLLGDLVYDTNTSVMGVLLGAVVAVIIAKVIEFFNFFVDYSRTEKVQFEDDEYYYYVKAVPKMTVSEQTKTVKRINTPIRTGTTQNRSYQSREDIPRPQYSRTARATTSYQPDMETDDYEEIF